MHFSFFVNIFILFRYVKTIQGPVLLIRKCLVPWFLLQVISVHKRVGQKPDITGIFIKCNNLALC